MQQNRIIESSNMLHYSNASSREKNRRYQVDQGGGACLEALQTKGIFGIVAVVEHRSINGLGVYHSIGVYRK